MTADQRLTDAERTAERSPKLAEERFRSIVDDFEQDDPGVAARAAYSLARLAVVGAEPRVGLDWIERARDLFGRAELPVAQARTDLGRINVLNELGMHREAVAVGQALIAHLSDLDQSDEEVQWTIAGAAENTGASFGWLGRHAAALKLYDQAGAVYVRIGDATDRARVSANRGVELLELGRHGEALDLLTEAGAAFESEGDGPESARCLAYAAKAHAQAGRYGDSVDALAKADAKLGPLEQSQDHLRMSLVWAEVYAVLNLTDEALDRCNALIPRFDESGMTRDAGLAELVKATVLAGSDAVAEAIEAGTAAERRFEAASLPAMTARCHLLRSELVDPDQAKLLAERAFSVLLEAGHAAEAAEAALRCAELTPPLEASTDASDNEVDHLQQAADLIADHDLDALGWRVDFIRGRRAEAAGTERLATVHYQRALDALRILRSSIGPDTLRVPFMGRRRKVQEALVFLQLRLGDVDAAAEVTEAERAETLVGRLTSGDTDTDPAAKPGDPGKAEPVADVTMTYQTLDGEIVCFVRRHDNRRTDRSRTEDSARPGNHVDDHDEIHLVRTKMTVSETSVLLRKLDAQWRRFEDPRLNAHQETLRQSTERLLQALYLGLFEPAEIHLEHEDTILVVPAGILANVPFHALHDGLAHLIDRYRFSVTPSASVAERPAERVTARPKTVVVGVADLAAPHITAEAEQVAELTDGTLLLDEQATVEAVREQAEQADVLHLACHGLFRPDNPWFSALRLADGWVRALDIERWDLRGTLVVLAACRSGQQSGMGGGDELLGIPRACLAAGASAVVVNLWPVDDRESVGLMTAFHQRIRIESPVAALRTAQRAALTRTPHPYHWAPTILYGSPRWRTAPTPRGQEST